MIRKLKKSFVAVTMISAVLVLTLLMGAVNCINYMQYRREDLSILEFLSENSGRFPQLSGPSGETDGTSQELPGGGLFPGPGEEAADGLSFGRRRFSAETPYETRYFSVTLAGDGTVAAIDLSRIASISSDEAASLAAELHAAGKTSGLSGSYRYVCVKLEGSSDSMYIFLNCDRSLSAVRSFLVNSLAVTAAALLILLLLVWLLSGRAVRPIADSYQKQKSFITNAGHELKTPLAVISSCNDVIEIEQGESKWTQSIRSQVDRMTSLTQELIALSRMDEGSALPVTDTDISAVVSEAVAPYILLAEQKDIPFSADIASGIRRSSNAEALRKITGILADNAVKYTTGPVSFSLRESGGHVILCAENPADGLAAGKQEILFDRFYRADASRSSETPGYGLGLPLARSLAEALGGSVQAVSPDGKRLSVTLRLP